MSDLKIPRRGSPGAAGKAVGWSRTKILDLVHRGKIDAVTDGAHIYIVGESLERLIAAMPAYRPGSITNRRAVNLEKIRK